MTQKLISTRLKKLLQNWIALLSLLLLALTVGRGVPVWGATAREINQTVPDSTKTRTPTPVPPATPTPAPPRPATATPPSSNSGGNQQSASTPTNTPTATTPTASKPLTGTVRSNTLNLRSGPGTSFLAIGVLKLGTVVTLIEQNQNGEWWRVCCLPGGDVRGWVSASFITPAFAVAEVQKTIPVVSGNPPAPTPTAPPPTPIVDAGATVVNGYPAPGTAIEVQMQQSPPFPLQGALVTFQISVTNPTQIEGLDVELRDELPQGMSIVNVFAAENAVITQDVTANLREVYSVIWPTLEVGVVVTVTAQLRIDPSLANGSVIDNLVFAGGSNLPGTTAGVSIGMPPLTLPEFQ